MIRPSQPVHVFTAPNFDRWLSRLRDRRARLIVANRLDRLRLGIFGDVRPVGAGVSELRIDFGPGYRLYFTKLGDAIVILLIGGDKASQSHDIALAKQLAERAEEFINGTA